MEKITGHSVEIQYAEQHKVTVMPSCTALQSWHRLGQARIVFIGMSIFSWVMVFRASTRRKFNEPGYDFWRLNKEGRESFDAMVLASNLIIAMVFSLLLLVLLVVGIYRFFAR